MRRIIHISQSISGALKNWSLDTWKQVAVDNGMTVEGVKQKFRIMEFEGKKVIPLDGVECDGFSYIDGCPGHCVEDV